MLGFYDSLNPSAVVALISGLSWILCFASQSKRIAYVAKCIPESSTPETRAGWMQAQLMQSTAAWPGGGGGNGSCWWIVKSFAWQFGCADNYRAGEVEREVMVEMRLRELVQGFLSMLVLLENWESWQRAKDKAWREHVSFLTYLILRDNPHVLCTPLFFFFFFFFLQPWQGASLDMRWKVIDLPFHLL